MYLDVGFVTLKKQISTNVGIILDIFLYWHVFDAFKYWKNKQSS